ncbi:MAG: amidohydrolase family protein, partial [Ktedonobacterales bacterium]
MSSASSRSASPSTPAASQPSRRALAAERTWYDGRFQRDLAVIIADGRIERVAALREVEPTLPVERFPRRLLLPGTINAHNHSFQSLLRGVADDCDFFTWRDRALYGYTPRMTEEVVYHGARFAFAEMLRAGVTTVC